MTFHGNSRESASPEEGAAHCFGTLLHFVPLTAGCRDGDRQFRPGHLERDQAALASWGRRGLADDGRASSFCSVKTLSVSWLPGISGEPSGYQRHGISNQPPVAI